MYIVHVSSNIEQNNQKMNKKCVIESLIIINKSFLIFHTRNKINVDTVTFCAVHINFPTLEFIVYEYNS